MKRLLALSLIGSSLLLGSNQAKADYDFIGLKRPSADDGSATAIELFTVDSKTGNSTSVTKKCFDKLIISSSLSLNGGISIDIF